MTESGSLWNGLLFQIAKHWIAGETYEEALERAQQANGDKLFAIINLLGEEVAAKEETTAATTEYLEILKAVDARKIRGCISIKPTQLGLSIDKKLFESNLNSILSAAKLLGNFVWIDIEGSPYTADTIDSYLEFRKKFDNVGVAIQAYLKRSEEDVNRILDAKGMIRLVKGAYNESQKIAFKRKNQINENYSKLMRSIFERGQGFAIATHHEKLIEEAAELSKSRKVDFEFEMLMGIRDKKKIELAQRGYRMSEYIPYGKGWWPYSVRRMREHKSNIFLLARSLVSG
ncbi:MAG: proline dehydrogenase family protein [Candidatus Bathyarchaeia archaeon]